MRNHQSHRLPFIAIVLLLAACSRPSQERATTGASPAPASTAAAGAGGDTRRYLLETIDDAAVVQLYADGFSALPLKEKTLIWHLYQAALAGRDIFIDQKHKDALEMREVIEQIIAYPQGVDDASLTEI